MDDNKKEVTVVEVFNKLEEVEKQNKEILEKLENMQESNALFHNGFATIFEVLRGLNEVKQNEEQYHKGYCKAVEDICNSLKAVLKKNK